MESGDANEYDRDVLCCCLKKKYPKPVPINRERIPVTNKDHQGTLGVVSRLQALLIQIGAFSEHSMSALQVTPWHLLIEGFQETLPGT